jgi:hypothetical protein
MLLSVEALTHRCFSLFFRVTRVARNRKLVPKVAITRTAGMANLNSDIQLGGWMLTADKERHHARTSR